MRERGGNVKAMPVQSTDKNSLQGLIAKNVQYVSTVYTDEHRSYMGLQGYNHQSVNHSANELVNAKAHTNGMKSVWAILKRGYNGVYHNMSMKHLHRYIDEFTFRLNAGSCKVDTIDRITALFGSVGNKKISYQELTN